MSADDVSDLLKLNDEKEYSRRLMVKLHTSHHPGRFIELRHAIKEELAYQWFIERLDGLQLQEPVSEVNLEVTSKGSDQESHVDDTTPRPGLQTAYYTVILCAI
jgi:hypothetical protein